MHLPNTNHHHTEKGKLMSDMKLKEQDVLNGISILAI